tara:strand:- start:497 stop:1108 length:612 start_codon:yes stop_codon:yes gene_type:complete
MRSLSEIETVSKRASKAAGFSWGVAEEVGKNIKILEMFGLPGIKNLNDYYKKKKVTKFENINLINADNRLVTSQACPVALGTNFLDQIRTLEILNKISFEKIAYPLLFLPFLSRSSEIIGKRLFVKFDEKEFLLNFNNNIYSNFLKHEIIELAHNVSVKFIDNSDLFTENEWNELYKLSENTFVEENDSLKQVGAGAGLTDND